MDMSVKVAELTGFFFRSRVMMCAAVIAAFLLIAVPSASEASGNNGDGDWAFAAELYLWYASIGGQTAADAALDLAAGDLIDGLNLAFMGNVAMKKDRWGVMIDAIYLDASDNQNVTTRVGGINAKIELSSWIITPMVGYEVLQSDNFSMNIVAGARYLYLDSGVDLRNANPAGPAFSVSASDSGNNWDGIIGVRGDISLSDHWFIPYHLDIGAGNSKFTWQGFAGLGYRFKHFDILAGYRYLSWEFDDNKVFEDLNVSGVGAGIKFYF